MPGDLLSLLYIFATLILTFRGFVCALDLVAAQLRAMSLTGSDGGSMADARMDGRKRPISSPPSLLPSQYKKNRLPSDLDPCADLSCGDTSQTLMKRIDEFFDPPPCDPSSDLLWSKPHDPLQDVFSDASPPPYIVLMESTRPGKNLGKYDRLALGSELTW